jgi:hypothetical protein
VKHQPACYIIDVEHERHDEPTLGAPYRPLPARVSPDDDLARLVLRPEVASHADLLWVGRPARGIRLQASDAFAIPFSLLWGGFVTFWETAAIVGHAPLTMLLAGLPFAIVGQYLIWGRFLVDARRRARTFYGLTADRAIVVTTGRVRKVQPVQLRPKMVIELEERRDGRGTIWFGRAVRAPGRRGWAPPLSFEMIDDARAVYARIREIVGQ